MSAVQPACGVGSWGLGFGCAFGLVYFVRFIPLSACFSSLYLMS